MLKTLYKFKRFYLKHYRWFAGLIVIAITICVVYSILVFSDSLIKHDANAIKEKNERNVIFSGNSDVLIDIKYKQYYANITLVEGSVDGKICTLSVTPEDTNINFELTCYESDFGGNGLYVIRKCICTLRSGNSFEYYSIPELSTAHPTIGSKINNYSEDIIANTCLVFDALYVDNYEDVFIHDLLMLIVFIICVVIGWTVDTWFLKSEIIERFFDRKVDKLDKKIKELESRLVT